MLDSIYLIKFFATFSILIIIMYAIYYYLKNHHPQFRSENSQIEVIESKMIGKNRYLFLVSVKESEFLLLSDEKGTIVVKEWKKSGS